MFLVVVDHGHGFSKLIGGAEWGGCYGLCLGQSLSFIFLR